MTNNMEDNEDNAYLDALLMNDDSFLTQSSSLRIGVLNNSYPIPNPHSSSSSIPHTNHASLSSSGNNRYNATTPSLSSTRTIPENSVIIMNPSNTNNRSSSSAALNVPLMNPLSMNSSSILKPNHSSLSRTSTAVLDTTVPYFPSFTGANSVITDIFRNPSSLNNGLSTVPNVPSYPSSSSSAVPSLGTHSTYPSSVHPSSHYTPTNSSSNAAASSFLSTIPQDCLSIYPSVPVPYNTVFSYPYFNCMQSTIFDAVFNTDSNVAIAAPTGTGKTVAFDLGILRLLTLSDQERLGTTDNSLSTYNPSMYTKGNGFLPSYGKVVYLAPLKALCLERQNDWSQRFGALGLTTVAITGDTDTENDDGTDGGNDTNLSAPSSSSSSSSKFSWLSTVTKADIIVTTPEKWDAMTRNWRDNVGLIGRIRVLCIDEVHTLSDNRGATLEAVVTRMRTVAANIRNDPSKANWPANFLRTIAVSATCPNLSEVGRWIGAGPETIYAFGDEFRPVHLVTHVIGYESRSNGFLFEKYLDTRLFEVIQMYSNNRPTLVFCASRNGVRMAAEQLVKDSYQRNPSSIGNNNSCTNRQSVPTARGYLRDPYAVQECTTSAAQIKDNRLAECVRHGVGYHSAAAASSDRSLIERLFGQGVLPILCTTTTLAMGVNLPAHLVVIKSTQAWRGSGSGYSEYPSSTLLQMIGRAGRSQFDTSGVAVIMTSTNTAPLYRSLAAGSEPVESSLRASLIEHLAAEVCLGTVTSLSTARLWIRTTFLASRMMANPRHYNLPPGANQSMIYRALDSLLCTCLYSLHIHRCVQMNYGSKNTHHGNTIGSSSSSSSSGSGKMEAGKLYNPTAATQILQLCQQLTDDPTFNDNSVGSHRNNDTLIVIDADESESVASSSSSLVSSRSHGPGTSEVPEILLQPLGPAFVMIRHYISFDTLALFPTINRDADTISALLTLCKAKEIIASLALRRDEKKLLREIKERAGRMKVKAGKEGTVSTIEDKAFQLAQAYLGRLKLDTLVQATNNRSSSSSIGTSQLSATAGGSVFHLRIEISHTAEMLHRIARAFMAWCNCNEVHSPLYAIASGLSRGFDQQLWPDTINEQGQQLLQLNGITETLLPSFINGLHCTTLADLQLPNITAANINIACRKMNDFGTRIKAQALALLPRLGLEVVQTGTDTEGSGAALLSIQVIEISAHHIASDIPVGGNAAQRSITDYMDNGNGKALSSTLSKSSSKGNAKQPKLTDKSSSTTNGKVKGSKSKVSSTDNHHRNSNTEDSIAPGSSSSSSVPSRIARYGNGNDPDNEDIVFRIPSDGPGKDNTDETEDEDIMGKRTRTTTYTSPAADTKLANNHKYTLVVTTIDKVGGLIFYRTAIRQPCTVQVRIPRPIGGPVVQIHLLHTYLIGMDVLVTFKPVYPFSSRFNTSLSTNELTGNNSNSISSSSSTSDQNNYGTSNDNNSSSSSSEDEDEVNANIVSGGGRVPANSTATLVPSNRTVTVSDETVTGTLSSSSSSSSTNKVYILNPTISDIALYGSDDNGTGSDNEEFRSILLNAEIEGEKAVQQFRQARMTEVKSFIDTVTQSASSINDDIADLLNIMENDEKITSTTNPISAVSVASTSSLPPASLSTPVLPVVPVSNPSNSIELTTGCSPSQPAAVVPLPIKNIDDERVTKASNVTDSASDVSLLDSILNDATNSRPGSTVDAKAKKGTPSLLAIPSGFENKEEAKVFQKSLVPLVPVMTEKSSGTGSHTVAVPLNTAVPTDTLNTSIMERNQRLQRAKEQQSQVRQRLGLLSSTNVISSTTPLSSIALPIVPTNNGKIDFVPLSSDSVTVKPSSKKGSTINCNDTELSLLLQRWDDDDNTANLSIVPNNMDALRTGKGQVLATTIDSKVNLSNPSYSLSNGSLLPPLPTMITTAASVPKDINNPSVPKDSVPSTLTSTSIPNVSLTGPSLRIPSSLRGTVLPVTKNGSRTNAVTVNIDTAASSDIDALLIQPQSSDATTTTVHRSSEHYNTSSYDITSPPAGVPTTECLPNSYSVPLTKRIDQTAATAGRIQITDIITRSYQPPPPLAAKSTVVPKSNAIVSVPPLKLSDVRGTDLQQFVYQPNDKTEPPLMDTGSSNLTRPPSLSNQGSKKSTVSGLVATGTVRESIALLKEKVSKLSSLNSSFRSTNSSTSLGLLSPRSTLTDTHNLSFASNHSSNDNMLTPEDGIPPTVTVPASANNPPVTVATFPSTNPNPPVNTMHTIMESVFADYAAPLASSSSSYPVTTASSTTLTSIQQNENFPYQRLRPTLMHSTGHSTANNNLSIDAANGEAYGVFKPPMPRTSLGTLNHFPSSLTNTTKMVSQSSAVPKSTNTTGSGLLASFGVSKPRSILSGSALRLRTAASSMTNSNTIDKTMDQFANSYYHPNQPFPTVSSTPMDPSQHPTSYPVPMMYSPYPSTMYHPYPHPNATSSSSNGGYFLPSSVISYGTSVNPRPTSSHGPGTTNNGTPSYSYNLPSGYTMYPYPLPSSHPTNNSNNPNGGHPSSSTSGSSFFRNK